MSDLLLGQLWETGENQGIDRTVVKSTLSRWMDRIASVLPCMKDLVMAGSYTHSIRPTTSIGLPEREREYPAPTYHIDQNTPLGRPSGQTRPD